MKKLLLISLVLINQVLLPAVPAQNIFSDIPAYEPVIINNNTLREATFILSQDQESTLLVKQKDSFCWELIRSYKKNKLTPDTCISALKNYQQLPNNDAIMSPHHTIELLKEQKNKLIRNNNSLVKPNYDTNYARKLSLLGLMLGSFSILRYNLTPQIGKEVPAIVLTTLGFTATQLLLSQ